MAKEDANVHLVSALNQDTLARLDAYVIMCGGDKMAHLETNLGPAAPCPLCPDASVLEVRRTKLAR